MNKLLPTTKAFIALGLVLTFILGSELGRGYETRQIKNYFENSNIISRKESLYDYTSPSVGTDAPQATSIGLYQDTYDEVVSVIEKEKKSGKLSDISFYYRDLNTTTWFGYNEGAAFVPASLLKLLYALAVYKQEEDYPGFLNQRVQFTRNIYEIAANRSQPMETTLTVGNWYSIQELVTDMITNSDNSARDLLSTVIYEKYLNELYFIIGIQIPELQKEYEISAKDYSLFLRVLYNSKFINEKHSNDLLTTLAKTTFTEGLVSGVKDKVQVAHKYGVYTFEKDGRTVQEVHDCGIVYYPGEPYLLCIMTKGTDQGELAGIISTLSKVVYTAHEKEEL
jgi:beta-lactamase class A